MKEIKKIVVINGSHRGDKGYTGFLLKLLEKGVTEAGGAIEVINLARLKIKQCISCGKCNSPEHYLKCVFGGKDDVETVVNKMREADLIVIATPIYVFGMTGLLKTFLDRIYYTADVFKLEVTQSNLVFHHVDEDFRFKPMMGLICCDNIEKEMTKNAIKYFQTYARFHDSPLVGMLVRQGGRIAGHGKDSEATRRLPKLQKTYEAFEQAGRELVMFGRIHASTQSMANRNIMPIPPIARLLMKFRPFKVKVLKKAQQDSKYTEGAV